MYRQHGIYKVVLRENIGQWIYYENGILAGISTTGNEITLSSCDNIHLDFNHESKPGRGGKLLNSYSVDTTLFDFTKETLEDIDNLASVFGYLPILFFRNGDVKALLTPLFLESSFDYNEINTQAFNITLSTQVPTCKFLIDYEEIVSGSAILAEDGSAILAEDNNPILTD